MDFLPGIEELKINSEKAAEEASKKQAGHEKSLQEKARQEQLMQKMAQEYYQKMDDVTSPVRCLSSQNQSFFQRIFGDRNCVTGHVIRKAGGAANSHIYYVVDADGHRWAAAKDSSAKRITWFVQRIAPYNGKQVQRTGSPSDSWKRALTVNLQRAADELLGEAAIPSEVTIDAPAKDKVAIHQRILGSARRRQSGEPSEPEPDTDESEENNIDLSERLPY